MFSNTDILVKHQRFSALPPLMQHGIIGGLIDTTGDYPKPNFLQTQDSSNVLNIVGTAESPLRMLFSNGIKNNNWDNFIKMHQTTENVTIDQSCYIYAEVDGEFDDIRFKTIPIYNNIIYSHFEPAAKYDGDYWFDIDNNQFKVFDINDQQYHPTQRWDENTQTYINTAIVILAKAVIGPNSFVLEYWYPNKGMAESYQEKYLSSLNPNSDEAIQANIYRYQERVNYVFPITYDYNFQYVEQTDIPDFRFGEHSNTTYTSNGLERSNTSNFGYRITPNIDLSPLGFVNMTKVEWVKTGDVTIESTVSFDNGQTFSDWQVCVNGESLLQLVSGENLDTVVVKFKQNLNESSAILESFTFSLDSTHKDLSGDISIQTPIGNSPSDSVSIDEYPFSLQSNGEFITNNFTDYHAASKYRIKKLSTDEIVYETVELYDDLYEHTFDVPWDLSVELGIDYVWQIQYKSRVYELYSLWSDAKQFYLKDLSQPVNQSPDDLTELTEFPLTLKADDYLPHHILSKWQILDETDTVVYDSGEVTDLIEHTISELWTGFAFDHTYKFQVQYKSEKYQAWTNWSNPTTFVYRVYKPENISPKNNMNGRILPILETSFSQITGDNRTDSEYFDCTSFNNVVISFYMNCSSMDNSSEYGHLLWWTGSEWKIIREMQNGSGNYTVNIPNEWLSSENYIQQDIVGGGSGNIHIDGNGSGDYLQVSNIKIEGEYTSTIPFMTFPIVLESDTHNNYTQYSQYLIEKDATTVYDTGEITNSNIHEITTLWTEYLLDVEYQWKVRHKSEFYGIYSEWSDLTDFIIPSIQKPINLNYKNSTDEIEFHISLKCSPLHVSNLINVGTIPHDKSLFKITKVSDGTIIYESGEIDELTEHNIMTSFDIIEKDVEYQWQVQHKITGYDIYSEWSDSTKFIIPRVIQPLNIEPADQTRNIIYPLTLKSNDFKLNNDKKYPNSHGKSQWQIFKMPEDTLVYDSGEVTDLIEHTINDTWADDVTNSDYEWKVRHKALYYNLWSEWSNRTSFSIHKLPKPEIVATQPGVLPELIPLTLKSSNMDYHSKSRWIIQKKSDGTIVYDSGETTGALTSITITESTINNHWTEHIQENTTYQWKVQHYSSMYNLWTEWSNFAEFITPHISVMIPEIEEGL